MGDAFSVPFILSWYFPSTSLTKTCQPCAWTIIKKTERLPWIIPIFFSGRKSVENIPAISAIGLTPLRMNRCRKTITFISYMEVLLKRSPTQRFRKFWRNCSFCWAPFYLLYHLNLVILAKTAISKIFRNFWWNCRNRSFCWAPFYIYYHLNLVILTKTAISKIFRNFCYCVKTWTYLGVFGWGCPAGTLEPLAYASPCINAIFLPYSRLGFKICLLSHSN